MMSVLRTELYLWKASVILWILKKIEWYMDKPVSNT